MLELGPPGVLWRNGPEMDRNKKVADLRRDGEFTVVMFKHRGWKEPVEFMHHCSTKWATYLLSMKSLLESGQGAPFPNDVHISARGD